jgi:hypothetical protein
MIDADQRKPRLSQSASKRTSITLLSPIAIYEYTPLGWIWAATLVVPILPVIAASVGDFGRIT